MRIVCLDIGSKRIGVAVSDPLGWTAQGVGVIRRQGGERDLAAIAEKCRELSAELIVVGLPLGEEGEVGPAAARVKRFVERLRGYLRGQSLDLPIETWDERYSTAIAEERLIAADVSRAKRRRVIDKMAAMAILQDYLEAHAAPADAGEGIQG